VPCQGSDVGNQGSEPTPNLFLVKEGRHVTPSPDKGRDGEGFPIGVLLIFSAVEPPLTDLIPDT
jgi:hypothetical protein